ncbi:MAG: ATP-binding cassette domain-containing protein [Bacilli bacterium]|nr:ATP-binding cassette domain-containing protein [Bacilli bacterium]
MLELKNIKKVYDTGIEKVNALKGINLKFRKSEFVSILGESGCGKTTLLNIIGGLDRYTSGDLIINGKSTKKFKDKDWDSYRNYSVGFIFQSYNLISHQTVLSNVALALTISGVSKKERIRRAKKALEEVGLKDRMYYKPNQLSGGQMQRVAIARAIVNNPDIVLADEPTGALDSKTSVQVMKILKKISKDRLVIMVTHNDNLANIYSNRIVKILDGEIIDDSNPIKDNEKDLKNKNKYKKTNMKFLTALQLSFNNLLTKKGRTILTSFAGSIGIIGIALILAISTGVQDYIDRVEEETLSSYPITIEESTVDMSSMMNNASNDKKKEEEVKKRKKDKVYSINIMNQIMNVFSNQVKNNNLTELKKYIESKDNAIAKNSNAIKYDYNLNLNLYKSDTSDGIVKVNPSTVIESIGAQDLIQNNSSSVPGMSNPFMNNSQLNVWTEMLDNEKLLKQQYDLLKGVWPNKYNEVVLIVNEDNEISDYALYTLGLKNQKDLKGSLEKLQKAEKIKLEDESTYSYDDILKLKYKVILNSDYYKKKNGIWEDMSDDDEYMKDKINKAEEIKVVGIIRQNKDSVATSMQGGIGYLKKLKEYVINKTNEQEIVKEQKDKKDTNIFSGLPFPKDGEKFDFKSLTDEQRQQMAMLSQEELAKLMASYSDNANATYESNLKKLGSVSPETPTSISIYPKDFDSKERIMKAIKKYNKDQKKNKKEENVITYSDIIGAMISSVSKIVDTVSYVLISFVAISLVVSSIMIGIITYISVLERTKEIGILRAIGVSKKDVARIFNAETLIIGFIAGLIGIIITILLTIPINRIIYNVTNVHVRANLPFVAAIILIIISIILTMIGGLIPARLASKKDPVIALRTE